VLLKLDHTTEDEIGHAKFSKIDLFVTALDNVAARNTVERISHMYNKPMIDGGTEGLEGSQENFIPNVTNEYPSTVSAPPIALFFFRVIDTTAQFHSLKE
jgi:molybdopterin/thiamine biosynthesis adenylyltransferase